MIGLAGRSYGVSTLQLLAAVMSGVQPGATDHRDGSVAAHAATGMSCAGPADASTPYESATTTFRRPDSPATGHIAMAANVLTLQPLDATRGFTVTTAFVPVPLVDPDAVGAEDAIEPMLDFIRAASGGRLLNMHLPMAQSPLVLDQYAALRRAIGTLATLDALLEVVREAAGGDGTVSDITWSAATAAGWTATDLAETYGYLAFVSYCDRFVRYARTEFDLAFAATAR